MHGTTRPSGKGAANPGQLAFELLHEQIRHGLAVEKVIGAATDREGIVPVQEDFIRTSLERMHLLTACCQALLQPETSSDRLRR